jgi:hypothetical protein
MHGANDAAATIANGHAIDLRIKTSSFKEIKLVTVVPGIRAGDYTASKHFSKAHK